MQPFVKSPACVGAIAALAAGLTIGSLSASTAAASGAMPVAQQNELVHRHCAVCHTDAARNGGLSLEHFDAADAAPSLAAMMISKLTSGVALGTVKAAASDPDADALVNRKMTGGAIYAAGIAVPDDGTIRALIDALASRATGAFDWTVSRGSDPAMLTASMLREVPSPTKAGEASMYRLVVACNTSTRDGEMQLTWAPAPRSGDLTVAVDGHTPVTYKVEGTEKMGNGNKGSAGPASIRLYESRAGAPGPPMPVPAETLTIGNLFPDQTASFAFDRLPAPARDSLTACFRK